MNINTEKKLIKEVTLSHETERKSFETKMKVRKSTGIDNDNPLWQCFGSGFNWVSGSGSRPVEMRPRKRKNEENSCLKSPNVLCMGFKKTYVSFWSKMFPSIIFFLLFCHKNFWSGFVSSNRLAPDTAKYQDPDSVNMDPKHLLIDWYVSYIPVMSYMYQCLPMFEQRDNLPQLKQRNVIQGVL